MARILRIAGAQLRVRWWLWFWSGCCRRRGMSKRDVVVRLVEESGARNALNECGHLIDMRKEERRSCVEKKGGSSEETQICFS